MPLTWSGLAGATPELFARANELGGAIVVVDAPLGTAGPPRENRHVDAACSRAGFVKRAQSYPVTSGTALELIRAVYSVLDQVGVPYTPWTGGPLPADGVVVAETNPTTAMAVSLPQYAAHAICARKRPFILGGRQVVAKSDFYWLQGACDVASSALGVDLREVRHHEHVAALFCLALAAQLDGSAVDGSHAVALGDSSGIYLAPAAIDASWEEDIERVGIASGAVKLIPSGGAPPSPPPLSVAVEVLNDEPDPAGDDDVERRFAGDVVRLVLNDSGGLTRAANPWLDECDGECRLRVVGHPGLEVVISRFAGAQGASQSKVSPSATALAARVSGRAVALKHETQVEILAEFQP